MALTKVLTGGLALDAVDNTILKLDDDYALTGDNSGAGASVKLFQLSWTSAIAQVLMNSVISATFDHYKLVGTVEVSANAVLNLILTTGGGSPSDATNTAVYSGETANRAGAAGYVGSVYNGNSGTLVFPQNNNIYGNSACGFAIELHDLFAGIAAGGATNVAAGRMRYFGYQCAEQNVASSDYHFHSGAGKFRNNTASNLPEVTGLKFAPSTGNFTKGNVALYGYSR